VGARAEDDVLAPAGVDENMLYVGEFRETHSGSIASRIGGELGGQMQANGTGLGEPDRMGSVSRQAWIGERSTVPTPPHGRGGRASA
jgi:hypothetical protein